MRELLPEESVATLEFDAFFESSGILDGWSMVRVERLTRILHCTVFELGKLCAVEIPEMKRFIKKRRFPPSVCLLFAIVEAEALRKQKLLEPSYVPLEPDSAICETPIIPVHLLERKEVA